MSTGAPTGLLGQMPSQDNNKVQVYLSLDIFPFEQQQRDA